jgi:hypothetical protein
MAAPQRRRCCAAVSSPVRCPGRRCRLRDTMPPVTTISPRRNRRWQLSSRPFISRSRESKPFVTPVSGRRRSSHGQEDGRQSHGTLLNAGGIRRRDHLRGTGRTDGNCSVVALGVEGQPSDANDPCLRRYRDAEDTRLAAEVSESQESVRRQAKPQERQAQHLLPFRAERHHEAQSDFSI